MSSNTEVKPMKKPGRKSRAELAKIAADRQQASNPLESWCSDFGDDYHCRNNMDWQGIKNRWRMFQDIFERMGSNFPRNNILEIGAGVGDNLRAIDLLYAISKTPIKLLATEPNEYARYKLSDIANDVCSSAIGTVTLPHNNDSVDLVFTSGVLIHIPPHQLGAAMGEIYRISRKWILSIEYFSAEPREVPYRGNDGMLWTRDFGSAWMQQYPNLRPAGNGFCWKPTTGLDNVTWWLFDKTL